MAPEFDTLSHHDRPYKFHDDRHRDAQLTLAGLRPVRLTGADLARPAATAALLPRHPPSPMKPLRDVIAPDLEILFCGINPSLMSAERGHHFARPGNRFWPALHGAGLTPRLMSPDEDAELPRHGLGITNLVDRPTRAASQLTPAELRMGVAALEALVVRHRPRTVAFVGIGAYRVAFERPTATIGAQRERIADAAVWVLPNPSGLNAHHQLPDLVRLFVQLRR